jgi:hypothetical protein
MTNTFKKWEVGCEAITCVIPSFLNLWGFAIK